GGARGLAGLGAGAAGSPEAMAAGTAADLTFGRNGGSPFSAGGPLLGAGAVAFVSPAPPRAGLARCPHPPAPVGGPGALPGAPAAGADAMRARAGPGGRHGRARARRGRAGPGRRGRGWHGGSSGARAARMSSAPAGHRPAVSPPPQRARVRRDRLYLGW